MQFQLSTTNYGLAGSLDVDKIGQLSRADIVERLGVRGVQMEAIDFERLTEHGMLCNQSGNMRQDQFHQVSLQYFTGCSKKQYLGE